MFSYVFPLRNPHVASFILHQCVHSPASLSHVAQAAREQLSVRRSRKSGSRVDGNEEKGGSTLWLCQNSYWKWPFIVSFPIRHGSYNMYPAW